MNFLLIATRPHTLPYAVLVENETVDGALKSADEIESEGGMTTFLFLVDLESESVKRMIRGADGWALSDTAFDELGVGTDSEYFEGEGA